MYKAIFRCFEENTIFYTDEMSSEEFLCHSICQNGPGENILIMFFA